MVTVQSLKESKIEYPEDILIEGLLDDQGQRMGNRVFKLEEVF